MLYYLLPPSEGKQKWWTASKEQTLFRFEKPIRRATSASPKDLKCTGSRYEEGMHYNNTINQGPWMPAIQRYTWVMFNAIGYNEMSSAVQHYCDNHLLIMSWMYWWVAPQDTIANYKLPVDTKWLKQWRGDRLTEVLSKLDTATFVDLLPNAHKKMLDFSCLDKVIHVDFFAGDKKLSHGVKSVKGQRLHDRCAEQSVNSRDRPTTMHYNGRPISVRYS